MNDMLSSARLRVLGALTFAATSLLLLPGAAMACGAAEEEACSGLSVKAKDFTEPVETQLGAAVPIVVGFLAAVFVVGYVIRWIMKRAKQAT